MGSPYREPRPNSPERIKLKNIDFAGFEEIDGYVGDAVTVRATFTYYTWCCNDSHEIADAVATLQKLVYQAAEKAEIKRLKKLREEHEEVLKEFNGPRDVQQ